MVEPIADLGGGLQRVDLQFQGEPGVIASYVLRDADETALLEIGPETSLDTLLAALERAHIDPAEITKVIVTHIHLDHAGAAGTFMSRFSRARLYVHELGAPHMVDPSRLLASASRIWGDDMERLWGRVDPVPAERVTIVGEGDTVRVGSIALRALYTPGHASHHLAYYLPDRNAVFTGDVTGVRLPDMEYVRPPTPPPDIDLDLWKQSVDRIRALEPDTLLLTHFGPFTDIDRHLADNMQRLDGWAGLVRERWESEVDRDAMVAELRERGDAEIRAAGGDDSAVARYELGTPYGMTVDGLIRYWRKRPATA